MVPILPAVTDVVVVVTPATCASRECSEQARGERDKAKVDLDRAERRNLQLLREADERLAGTEAFNRTRIR